MKTSSILFSLLLAFSVNSFADKPATKKKVVQESKAPSQLSVRGSKKAVALLLPAVQAAR